MANKVCSKCKSKENYHAKGLCKKCYISRWKRDNREKHNAYNRKWIAENPEKHRAKVKRWQQNNWLKFRMLDRENQTRRRTILAGYPHIKTLTVKLQKKIIARDKCCVYCGSQKKLSFDHIIPISKGGSNAYNNLVIACGLCNCKKSNKDVIKWCNLEGINIPRIILELLKNQKGQTRIFDIIPNLV